MVIFSVPPVFLLGPHLAPAMLKAYAAREGFNVKCINPSFDYHDSLPEEERRIWPYNNFEEYYKDDSKSLDFGIGKMGRRTSFL